MNTDRLVAAYDDLLTAAALLDPASLAPTQRDEAEWLIAHLILSDPILIAGADHLLARADTVVVDNRHATDDDGITAVLASLSTTTASKPSSTTAASSSTGTAESPRPPAPRWCGSSSTTDTAS